MHNAGHPTTAHPCASGRIVQDPLANPRITVSLTGTQEGQGPVCGHLAWTCTRL